MYKGIYKDDEFSRQYPGKKDFKIVRMDRGKKKHAEENVDDEFKAAELGSLRRDIEI